MSLPPLALLGSGEYLAPMAEVDRVLLRATGKDRPRVALVPTAAGLEDPRKWTDLGCAHFAALDADPIAVLAVDRASCDDARWSELIRESDVIYFSGGQPHHLLASIRGSRLWAAVAARHAEGAVLAGSSAGAMFLAEKSLGFPDGFDDGGPKRVAVYDGMRVLPGVMILPHYDAVPAELVRRYRHLVPGALRVLGIDEDTALLRLEGRWSVRGRGSVWLLRDGEVENAFASGTDLSGGLL